MNSLEFINEKIEMQKVAKESALKIIKEYEGIVSVNAYKESVKQHDKEIQTLQQIKTELEAWEVVKKRIHYEPSKDYIDLSLIYLGCPKEKKYQALKKALEV